MRQRDEIARCYYSKDLNRFASRRVKLDSGDARPDNHDNRACFYRNVDKTVEERIRNARVILHRVD